MSGSQDVWSLGILLYAMVTGHFPWHAASPDDERYSFFCEQGRLDACPRAISDLVHAMLSPVETRCTIEEVLEGAARLMAILMAMRPSPVQPKSTPV